jgi:hypothetical protein
MATRRAYGRFNSTTLFRAVAFLLLIVQLGMVAHRIEH